MVDVEQAFIVPLQLLFRKVPNIFFLKQRPTEEGAKRDYCVCMYACVGVSVYMEGWEGVGKVSNLMH